MITTKNLLLVILSGLLLSIPWLIEGTGFILFFSFVPLLWVTHQKTDQNFAFPGTSGFFQTLLAFLVWNLFSTWWIAYVSFSGMILIAFTNSSIMAIAWWSSGWFYRKFGAASGFFSLIVFWISFEFLQFYWTIQWPWLTLGNGFSSSVKFIQWYEFTGVLGGSVWILLSNILAFFILNSIYDRNIRKILSLSLYIGILIIAPSVWSFNRYNTYPENGKSYYIKLLQPNIDPYTEKFSGINAEVQLKRLLSLAEISGKDSLNLIVAPETAFTSFWEDSIESTGLIKPIINLVKNNNGVALIGGAITSHKLEKSEHKSETSRKSETGYEYDTYNSAFMINQNQKMQIIHKNILVSGVEKIPFQKYFSFLNKYILDLGGETGSLASGNSEKVFVDDRGVKIGSAICFESAFAQHTRNSVKSGSNLLVVISNDGWWKESPGVWQHFNFSRLRAIETRRSVAISTNTGISGFVNQRGEVVKKTEINVCEAITSAVKLNKGFTFFVRNGDYIGSICLLLAVLLNIFLLMNWRLKLGKKNPH